jgi:hypothetical protein
MAERASDGIEEIRQKKENAKKSFKHLKEFFK